jgi:hypothetical protein
MSGWTQKVFVALVLGCLCAIMVTLTVAMCTLILQEVL